eukprot:CAMPEP_0203965750 /NCGR_PEP_ID=MMETSP0359-20131031/95165_1 /ASSEMBLY_ACC=CAM_ASM_000338 /TAXON_ID=268821 /ORGANISM="Scrippsiella Hangoei, Strain SHTV-5" /LENGTH=47 /DNA_ID= /DNA_START= /DNA_END= /DNA_ORIENTATION=
MPAAQGSKWRDDKGWSATDSKEDPWASKDPWGGANTRSRSNGGGAGT